MKKYKFTDMKSKLKLLAFFCSFMLNFLAFKSYSQTFITPNNSFGTNLHRQAPDSVAYYPTGCGTPTDTTFLFSQGFNGKGEKKKMSAKYYDSCGHREWTWDPSLKAWQPTDRSRTDTIIITYVGVGSPQVPTLFATPDGNERSARFVPGTFTTPHQNADSGVQINLDTAGPGGASYKAWIVAQYGPPGGGFGTVNVANSITGNGSLATPLQLSGDASAPGASYFYGTDAGGTKGWNALSTVLGLDPTLFNGNTAYQKQMTIMATPFGSGSPKRFFEISPDLSNGYVEMGDVEGNTTLLNVIMSQKSIVLRADSGLAIEAGGNSQFSFLQTQAAQTAGGFIQRLRLPFTGHFIDTLATLHDVRNSGGSTTNGVGRDTVQSYTSGSTLTQTSSTNYIQVNPSSTQAALTITSLASGAGTWHTSNDIYIIFGGTITSGPVITSFTFTAGSGLTKIESVTPTGTISAGEVIHYHKVGSFLYRIN